MTEHDELALRIERTFDARAEAVFDAWASEEVLNAGSLHAGSGTPPTPRSTCGLEEGSGWRCASRTGPSMRWGANTR